MMNNIWYLNVSLLVFFVSTVALVLYCFRDPKREIEKETKAIISPADGKIVQLLEEDLADKQKYLKISIFLSLFDVHIVRSPMKGLIRSLKHKKGKHLNALSNRAPVENANVVANVENDDCRITIKMISGFVARRIICYKQTGDYVEVGEKLGRIVFGSRVEVFMSAKSINRIKVKRGDRVKAGQTILCYIKS